MNAPEGSTVLVTGAAGFYGIHAVKLLLEAGHDVVAVGTSGFPVEPPVAFGDDASRVEFVRCDIADASQVADLFADRSIGTVIHAAVMTVLGNDEVGRERRIAAVNAWGTLNLLDTARDADVRRFVYVSSSGIYDSRGEGIAPVHESVSVLPGTHGMYRICKIFSEMVVQNFHEHGAFDVAIARIGSPYGPWERPTRSRKGMSLIFELVDLAIRGEEARVYGRDLTRDWTHMRDIARGTVLLATYPREALHHRIYNVTNGTVTSIERVLQTLRSLVPAFSYRFVETAEEANVIASIPYARGPLDIARLKEDTGFVPEFTIDDGLADYVAWAEDIGRRVMAPDGP